jgi:hypothetical protein
MILDSHMCVCCMCVQVQVRTQNSSFCWGGGGGSDPEAIHTLCLILKIKKNHYENHFVSTT